jgi:hypothetical protein
MKNLLEQVEIITGNSEAINYQIRTQMEANLAYHNRIYASGVYQYKQPKKLLSAGITNSKTAKNTLDTFILYLSPYNQNSFGINICPKASAGCIASCLFTAGRGRFSNVIHARQNRTEFFMKDKKDFLNMLKNELIKISKNAVLKGQKIAIRLNGTSDLDFIGLIKYHLQFNILDLPNLIYYDYTKIYGKALKYKDSKNYFVTLSLAENSNLKEIKSALNLGINVSAVFKNGLPSNLLGFPVIDGDKTDIEMLSNKGVILGLKAKGKAKKDATGFAITDLTKYNF